MDMCRATKIKLLSVFYVPGNDGFQNDSDCAQNAFGDRAPPRSAVELTVPQPTLAGFRGNWKGKGGNGRQEGWKRGCLLYTSPSPRD